MGYGVKGIMSKPGQSNQDGQKRDTLVSRQNQDSQNRDGQNRDGQNQDGQNQDG